MLVHFLHFHRLLSMITSAQNVYAVALDHTNCSRDRFLFCEVRERKNGGRTRKRHTRSSTQCDVAHVQV
uniref:Putative secreted protein n=1 Tax=Rhipicephalus microplus TaxID=6941 RepID=A0A6G5A1M5_RHIMP